MRRPRWSAPRLSLKQRRRLFGVALLTAPAVMLLGLFAYPFILIVNMSLREGRAMTLSDVSEQPVTLDNYRRLFTDESVLSSFYVTVIYTLATVVCGFLLGLAVALLLNRRFPGQRLFRALVLIPWAVPGTVAAIIFLFMLDPSYGIANHVISQLGYSGEPIAWYFDPDTALFAVTVPTIWKCFPFFTIMLLAALQAVPRELYEVAELDGAGAVRKFFTITWPAIRPTAAIALLLEGLWAFHAFDIIYPTTAGGPNGATETWAIKIYNSAFEYFQPGRAAALGVLVTVIGGIAVVFALRTSRRDFF